MMKNKLMESEILGIVLMIILAVPFLIFWMFGSSFWDYKQLFFNDTKR